MSSASNVPMVDQTTSSSSSSGSAGSKASKNNPQKGFRTARAMEIFREHKETTSTWKKDPDDPHDRYPIIAFFQHLIDGNGIRMKTGPDFTGETFVAEFPQGGKDHIEDMWRVASKTATGHSAPTVEYEGESSSADRDNMYEKELFHGQHEWIPTNMVGYVVEWAMAKKEIRWLQLADMLRTPTKNVILKPVNGKLSTGHVGALYVERSGQKPRALTKGQAGFHDGLRNILYTHLGQAANSIAGFEKDLLDYIEKTFWDGTELHGSCPYYYPGKQGYAAWGAGGSNSNAPVHASSSSTSLPFSYSSVFSSQANLTMENMSRMQKQEWEASMTAIRNQFRALKSQPAPAAFSWSNDIAAQGGFPDESSDRGSKDVQMKH
jgi:hypothetical protein